jgi:hypothetical protein
MASNLDLILGAGEGLSKMASAYEARQPASPNKRAYGKYMAEVAAGRMSGREAAIRERAENGEFGPLPGAGAPPSVGPASTPVSPMGGLGAQPSALAPPPPPAPQLLPQPPSGVGDPQALQNLNGLIYGGGLANDGPQVMLPPGQAPSIRTPLVHREATPAGPSAAAYSGPYASTGQPPLAPPAGGLSAQSGIPGMNFGSMTNEEYNQLMPMIQQSALARQPMTPADQYALQQLRNQGRMEAVGLQQEGANGRNAATNTAAGERNAATNTAAGQRTAANNKAKDERLDKQILEQAKDRKTKIDVALIAANRAYDSARVSAGSKLEAVKVMQKTISDLQSSIARAETSLNLTVDPTTQKHLKAEIAEYKKKKEEFEQNVSKLLQEKAKEELGASTGTSSASGQSSRPGDNQSIAAQYSSTAPAAPAPTTAPKKAAPPQSSNPFRTPPGAKGQGNAGAGTYTSPEALLRQMRGQ